MIAISVLNPQQADCYSRDTAAGPKASLEKSSKTYLQSKIPIYNILLSLVCHVCVSIAVQDLNRQSKIKNSPVPFQQQLKVLGSHRWRT